MDTKIRRPIPQDEISLKEILQLLRRRKWAVLLVTAVFTIVAGVAAKMTPKTYKAAVIVSATTNTPGSGQSGGLSSMVSQFSGLASLAGLAMGGDSHRAESIAVLQSEALTEGYIRDNDLLPVLYPKQWDAQQKRWKVSDPEKVPTVWKATQRFKRSIANVSTDTKTGLVTLTILWKDPRLAAKWANELVKKTNDYLRAKAIVEADRNIKYLNGEALTTDVVGVKTAIFSIMQNEINKEMLARGSDEYALKVVDPAFAPEEPYSPQPVMWVLIGLFAGLLLSLFAAFLKVAWGKE
ncbi:MAG: polysaccharide chain length determinant protein [Gammaproteobacteria bacterium]|nr:polysaccharide chain length determinant protein [Gammaproteobacteria bacterium]